jgi:DNA polymerase-1
MSRKAVRVRSSALSIQLVQASVAKERLAWHRGETETRTLTGRRRTNVEKLTDRLSAPVRGTTADGLKLALAIVWERSGACPRAVPVLECHDEIVVECNLEQATNAKAWLVGAMIEGIEVVLNNTDQVDVSAGVEARIVNV